MVEVDSDATSEIERDEWPAWCARLTEQWSDRHLHLSFVDEALGEIQLADGLPFLSIEHDQLGTAVAFTIRYGDGILPIRHVIAEPRSVREGLDTAGVLSRVTIEDSTRRKTFVGIS